ncbi:hypothetical protein GA0115252_107014 [Streptomyces sp. DfronAA-171]|nr:hypothetical protein GA0115252_107014 [Streptomyces sp. DfronAA-171]
MPAPSPHSPRPRRSPRARPLPRRPPSRRRRALRWAVRGLTGCSVAVLLAAGAGHTLLSGVDHKIGRVDAFKGLAGRPSAGHGMNLLLAGTDEREGLDEGDPAAVPARGRALPLHGHADDRAPVGRPLPRERREPAPATRTRCCRRTSTAPRASTTTSTR